MVDFLATWIGAKAVFTWWVNIVKGKPEVAQNQEDSPNATQIHVQGDVSGDVAGRDIDKSVQINVEPPLPQPITPTIDGVINRDSPDQTNFPGYSSFWDTVKYNPAFQGRQMRPNSLKFPIFI